MRSQPEPVIPVTVLETKLYVPRPREGQVPRSRLSERLDRGAGSKLVLVSAPGRLRQDHAAHRVAGRRRRRTERTAPAAWLSLDAGDNDPAHFWTYVIAGLRTLVAGDGRNRARAPPGLRRRCPSRRCSRPCSTTSAPSTTTSSWCWTTTTSSSRGEVHEAMAFLLDHLPPQLHLVIASRADPPLPLARLRARGELVEVRAADLRFTADEAASYLNEAMGLQLTDGDVATLEGRTEGWIAALQLAALSMQGRDDAADFIAGFAGDDRYVVDYLVEEVVQRQPRGRPGLPAPDLDPEPAERPAVRRGRRRARTAGRCCRGWSAATSSWSRSTTSAGGTATTTCSPTCCRRGCSTSDPSWCRSCTGGRAGGTPTTASPRRRSGTRWPEATSSGRRTWWS